MSMNPLQLEEPEKIYVSLVGSLQILLWVMLSQSLKRQFHLHIGKLKSAQSPSVEGCHGGKDELSLQERHLGTDRVAQGKEDNWL